MTSLTSIIAGAVPIPGGGFTTEVPAGWRQGRTTYGGLSGALALQAALGAADNLPPLRSAQLAFVGPLADSLTVRPTVLRHGRSAAFIRVEVHAGDTLGLTALFVFMTPQQSRIARDAVPRASHRPPVDPDPLQSGPDGFFTSNFRFDDITAEPLGDAEMLRWVRLRDRDPIDPRVELMAIGDALPPAALKLLGGFAPLSTLTWTLNFLEPTPRTNDGWWLLHADANRADGGYSSQHMTVWNAQGEAVAQGMQAVAIFA